MIANAGFIIQVIAGTDANGEPIPGYVRALSAIGDRDPVIEIVKEPYNATEWRVFVHAHDFARNHCGVGRVLHYPSLAVAAMPREGAA